MALSRVSSICIITAALILALIYGQSLIQPFILALFIWFVIKELREQMQRSKWIENKVPSWLLSSIAFVVIIAVLGLISKLLTGNIKTLSKSLPNYEKELATLGDRIEQSLGVDYKTNLSQYASSIDFASILEMLINSLSDLIGNTVMILIYLIFLLIEEQVFQKKLKALWNHKKERGQIQEILNKIDRSVGKYIGLKTLVSFITGVLSYAVLLMMDVEAAFFWSSIIFLLNYIPNIGSLVGTIFPAVFAFIQFGSWEPFLWVLLAVGAIQVLVGNVLEPKLMGNTLNLSPLVVILSLAFWGAIWGIIGMILSVPITVGILIACSAFPESKSLAILLSEKGRI
ncbi:MAG: AI-2E family transporter [Luteibaculum sp.]